MRRLLRLLLFALLSFPAPARAFWPDQDVDREELIAIGPHRIGSGGSRGESWISLVGFTKAFAARRELGVMAVVGLAFDRIAAGPVHTIADRPSASPEGPTKDPRGPPEEPPKLALDRELARASVAAAWRAAGLGVDDAKIDAIIARARTSAALPEARLRAMRLVTGADRVNVAPSTSDLRYSDYAAANLWLEARLTWHLDRLLYADDEPTLERVRLERIEARARLAARVLELLFQWQRALIDERDAVPGTREELEATMRALEAEVSLDVVTAGWFSKIRKGANK